MSKNPYFLRWLQSTAPDKRNHVLDDFQGQLKSLQEHGVLDDSVEQMFNQLVYCNHSVRIQRLQGNEKNRKRTNKHHVKEGIKKRKTEQLISSIVIIKEDKNKTRHNAEERKIKPNTGNDKLTEKVKKKDIINADQNKSVTEIRTNKQGDEGNSKRKNDITKVAVKSRSTNEKVAFGKSNEINKTLEGCSSSLSGDVHKIKTHSIIKHKSSKSIENCNKSKKSNNKDEQENRSNCDNHTKKRDSRTLEKSNQISEWVGSSNKQDIRKSNDLNKKLKECKSNTSNNVFKKTKNETTRHVESSCNKTEKVNHQIMELSNKIPEVGSGGTSKRIFNANSNEINKELKECKTRINNDNVQKTKNNLKKQGESKSIIKGQSKNTSEIVNKCKENIKKHQQENNSHDKHTKITEGTEQSNEIQRNRTKEKHHYKCKTHDGYKKQIVDGSERQTKDKKIQSGTQIKLSKKKEDKTGRKKSFDEKAKNSEVNNEHRNENIIKDIAKNSRQLHTAGEPDYTRVTPSLTPSECNDIWADQGLAPPQLQAQTILSGSKTTHPLGIREVVFTIPLPPQPAPTTILAAEAQCTLNAPIEIFVGRMDQLPPITQLVAPLKKEIDLASRQFEESHCAEKQEFYELEKALLLSNGESSDILSVNDESVEASFPVNDIFKSSAIISAPTTELVPQIKQELVRKISLKKDIKTEHKPLLQQDLMRMSLLENDTKHILHNLKPEPYNLEEALLPSNGVCESSDILSANDESEEASLSVSDIFESSPVISEPTTELVPLIKQELVRKMSLKNDELVPPVKLDLMRRNLLENNTQDILRDFKPDAGFKVEGETPILDLLASLKEDPLKKANQEPLLPINSGPLYFNLFNIYKLYLELPESRPLTAVADGRCLNRQ